jgi:hypothetical protein
MTWFLAPQSGPIVPGDWRDGTSAIERRGRSVPIRRREEMAGFDADRLSCVEALIKPGEEAGACRVENVRRCGGLRQAVEQRVPEAVALRTGHHAVEQNEGMAAVGSVRRPMAWWLMAEHDTILGLQVIARREALRVEIGINASEMMKQHVARCIGALHRFQVSAIDREELRVARSDEIEQHAVRPKHILPARIARLPARRLARKAIGDVLALPGLVDDFRDHRGPFSTGRRFHRRLKGSTA